MHENLHMKNALSCTKRPTTDVSACDLQKWRCLHKKTDFGMYIYNAQIWPRSFTRYKHACHIHTHTHTYTFSYVCIHTCECIHACENIHACECYACYVCIRIYVCIHTYIHT